MTVPPATRVDQTDRRILAELGRNGRASLSDVARRVHVSRANAYARVRRMIGDGVIKRFGAEICPVSVGLGTSAYVSLTIQQDAWVAVSRALRRIPGVDRICLCSGEVDVIVMVRTVDNTSLRDLVLEHIRSIPGVLTTRTVVVLDEFQGQGVTGALQEADPEPEFAPGIALNEFPTGNLHCS